MALQGRKVDVSNGQRVLVVDDVSDSAEVLRAVLAPRGVHVDRIRAGRFSPSDQSTPQTPSVVVIDMEPSAISPAPGTSWEDVPQVIIGSARLSPIAPQEEGQPARQYLRKPFEYAELVRAIEKFIR